MEITGYLAAALIGISLGLIGGGGSILTVPVLVYLFHISPVIATAYSLFIVGSSSMAGAFQNLRHHNVNIKVALIFGIPSVFTVFLFRKVVVPLIPDIILQTPSFSISKGDLILVLFALLMIFAAWSMLQNGNTNSKFNSLSVPKLIVQGIITGTISGLLGAGGGFIIIPSLVLFAGLEIKKAVGTSLLIIAFNSLIGFTGDLFHFKIEWTLLLTVSALAIGGAFAGNYISGFISSAKLKRIFGWFTLLMGSAILIAELFFK